MSESDSDDERNDRSSTYDDRINQSIALNLIVKCNLPPSVIEQPGFRQFMKVVARKWKPSSARFLKTRLVPSLYESLRKKINLILEEIDHISVTIDIWTDRRGKAFIGVTGHFIDIEFKSQAVLLDFVRIRGSHTAENIRNWTKDMLEKLGITHKIYRVITDNASNMIKAYQFGLVVDDEDQQDQEDSSRSEEYSFDTNTTEKSSFDIGWTLTDLTSDMNEELVEMGQANGRLSCFAHSLQLVIRDGLKSVPYLSKTLAKCKELSKKSHKSTKVADLLDDLDKRLSRSNITRWNSEYLLVRSIIGLGKKNIEDITNAIGDDSLSFNNTDFSVLEEVVNILEPFAEITTTCQSETAATISMIVPSIVHIMDHLKQMSTTVLLLKKLISQLDLSIHTRFAGIVKRLFMKPVAENDPFNDPLYFIATLLDPKFKFRWTYLMSYSQSMESKLKHSMISMVLDECERNTNRNIDQSSAQQSASSSFTTQTGSNPNIRKRKLFQYDDSDDLSSSSSNLKAADALTAYINESNRTNSLTCWKNSALSPLKDVVKRVFSVQASSAPIERTFSQSGLIMSPRRTSMRDDLFQSLVFLRVNHQLL